MSFIKKIKKIIIGNTDQAPKFEYSSWCQEQISLGKLSGIDTSIYEHLEFNPILMECIRIHLELGSSPSAIKKIVAAYLKHEINEKELEKLCEESIYIIDINYLQNKFRVKEEPQEIKKQSTVPTAFYGACFGDIAGSVYEFSCKNGERSALNVSNCINAYSQATDDTILSCATAKALIKNITLQPYDSLTLKDYSRTTCFPFIDNPFTDIYRQFAKMPFHGASYGGAFYAWVNSDYKFPYGSCGNGSAMRVSPIAECFDNLDELILYATTSAASTHNHIEGVKGAIVTAVAIWMGKQGYSKKQIFDYIIKFYPEKIMKHYVFRGLALKDFTMAELHAAPGPTLCQYSVPAAAICFYYSNSFEDVINNVLSFEGDTDTIGAIAGGIAGAYYGIPEVAKQVVEQRKPNEIFDQAIDLIQKSKEA